MNFVRSLLAATIVLGSVSTPAFAGPYIKGEAEAGITGQEYSGSTLEMVAGYEKQISEDVTWWTEAGVNYWMPEEGDNDTRFIVKTGTVYAASEQLDLYTEIGAKLSESVDDHYYGKVGFKYKF